MDIELTKQEQELLLKYRELNEVQQHTIRNLVAELHGDDLTLEVIAGVCASRHRLGYAGLGDIVDAWEDEDGNTCVRYSSGEWYHYRTDDCGHIEWW